MRAVRRLLVLAAGVIVVGTAPAPALAHPLGNFTVNLASRVEMAPGRVRIGYVVDLAEIPAQQARPDADDDGDETLSRAELDAWASEAAGEIERNLSLTVDGTRVALRRDCATASESPGQAGLPVLRLDAGFSGTVPESGSVVYRDGNYPGNIGWHEVTAAGVGGVGLEGSTVPARSVSDGLRSYPRDLLSSPLDVRTASFTYGPGPSEASASPACAGASGGSTGARPDEAGGGFSDLVSRSDLGAGVIALSLLLALGFGALHAIGPGHGKTLMAAYLVGADGRPRQAVAVGGAVAVMHTASVLALGVLVLSLERTFPPERVYPWLGLASGLVALGLGAALLVRRLGAWANVRRTEREHGDAADDARSPGAHHHARGELDHDHGPGGHAHRVPDSPVLSRRGLMALAVAGGILPSPTALVVLLSAVSFQRLAFGLALIAMFSVGLAASLIVVGLLALRARDAVSTRLSTGVGRLIPVLSASVIVAVGVFLTVRGASQL
jgi:nickel/cobalt transporter (NicO) family protein